MPLFRRAGLAALPLLACSLNSAPAAASELLSHLGGHVGATYGVGRLGNDELAGGDRTVGALSVQALPGYRFGKLLVGANLDYRWQGQYTALERVGGLNWRGSGYLLGVGASYRFNPEWYAMVAVDFLGRYSFDRQTMAAQDDHLAAPLGLRAKVGYFPLARFPSWSVDGDFQYLRFSELDVSGKINKTTSSQWILGVGVAYHFGAKAEDFTGRAEAASATASEPEPRSAPIPAPAPESGGKPAGGELIFGAWRTELSAEEKARFKKAAAELSKQPGTRIAVEGYTDSSGSDSLNQRLSGARAEAVKKFLVQHGVPADSIETKAMGSQNPIDTNDTKEGRSHNRRVEIRILP